MGRSRKAESRKREREREALEWKRGKTRGERGWEGGNRCDEI